MKCKTQALLDLKEYLAPGRKKNLQTVNGKEYKNEALKMLLNQRNSSAVHRS